MNSLLFFHFFITFISADPICDIFTTSEICDFSPGNVLATISDIASPDLCQEECLTTPNCNNFTWFSPDFAPPICYGFLNCAVTDICPDPASLCISGPPTPTFTSKCCESFSYTACDDQTNLIDIHPETEPIQSNKT